MTPFRVGMILVALVLAIGAAIYGWRVSHPPTLPPASAPPPASTPEAAKTPRYAIETPADAARPLPKLGESDPAMVEVLSGLFGADVFARLFLPEELVRRIVATIDNLPREAYATRLNPVRPASGLMRTTGKDADLAIAADNEVRYAAYVKAMQSLDSARLGALYARFYPLFQQAYVDLGFPNGYFNDRLVEVIDHLLDAPEVPRPILLVAPKVLYEYADPDLEARSAGQKLLIRIGPANAAKVKAKLRELRREIAKQ